MATRVKAPDPQVAEITAAGTAVNFATVLAGLLQELFIPALRPVPIFCDSQSTIFVARATAAIRNEAQMEAEAELEAEEEADEEEDAMEEE